MLFISLIYQNITFFTFNIAGRLKKIHLRLQFLSSFLMYKMFLHRITYRFNNLQIQD